MVETLPDYTHRSDRSRRTPPDGVTQLLRSATWPVHERLHLHSILRPLTARQPTIEGYRRAVRALYGFVAPMEGLLGSEAAGRASRTPMLLADLRALGLGDDELETLPVTDDLPQAGSIAARLGCRWVLDGSAHGGQAMLPHLQRSLGVRPDHGASYFASAGIDLAAEREELSARIVRDVATDSTRAEAAEAAASAFAALERWLDRLAALPQGT
jgi:heme oxygenase